MDTRNQYAVSNHIRALLRDRERQTQLIGQWETRSGSTNLERCAAAIEWVLSLLEQQYPAEYANAVEREAASARYRAERQKQLREEHRE